MTTDNQDRAPSSLAVRAYDEIKRRIVEGAIPPGYPLLETELAAEMGISRTPIREALARLKQEKLVTSIRRKGVFASTFSPSDMEQIYEMLEGLDSMAVKLAAERATQEDLRRLEQSVAAQEEALARDDRQAWIAADEAFHTAILEAARNRPILEITSGVNDQLRRVRRLTIHARRQLRSSTEMHRATVEAIRARDGDLARDLSQRHRAFARQELVGILRSLSPASEENWSASAPSVGALA